MASIVNIHNNAGFVCSFSVQWNGGGSGRITGQDVEIDLDHIGVPDGADCWVRAYIGGGPTVDSGGQFTYHPNSGAVSYTIEGSALDPSFQGPSQAASLAMVAGGVVVYNNASFCAAFSVQWDSGQTQYSTDFCAGQSATIDLHRYKDLPDGTSCWVQIAMHGGVRKDLGDFTYSKSSRNIASYTMTGGALTPSFSGPT